MNIVLSTLVGERIDNPKSVIEQGWSVSIEANTGCLIRTTLVHSICNGKVLAVELDPKNNTWTVTVEFTSNKWVRYCRLGEVEVSIGQQLKPKDLIGVAYKGLMRLEYCNSEKSQFPVRVLNRQLYKHDPTPIIFGAGNLEAL